MLLINSNNEYPRFIGDLQLAYPEWVEGDVLPENWFEVKEVSMPEITSNQVAYELNPELINGVYNQKWTVREKTEAELKEDSVRLIRQKVAVFKTLTAEEAALLVI